MISSLHLLHDKVKFAALGLIPLNVTLLAAVSNSIKPIKNFEKYEGCTPSYQK